MLRAENRKQLLARYSAPGLTSKENLQRVREHAQASRDYDLSEADVTGLRGSVIPVDLLPQDGSPARRIGVARAAIMDCKILAWEIDGVEEPDPIAVIADAASVCAWRDPEAVAAQHVIQAFDAVAVRLCCAPALCTPSRSQRSTALPRERCVPRMGRSLATAAPSISTGVVTH